MQNECKQKDDLNWYDYALDEETNCGECTRGSPGDWRATLQW